MSIVTTRSAARPGAHPSLDLASLDLHDLPDVSGLLARLLDERVPLALMADLASPFGPDSAQILEAER